MEFASHCHFLESESIDRKHKQQTAENIQQFSITSR
jgi:hypothetical protein